MDDSKIDEHYSMLLIQGKPDHIIEFPDWDGFSGADHDFRGKVPWFVQEVWPELTKEQKFRLAWWAQSLADSGQGF